MNTLLQLVNSKQHDGSFFNYPANMKIVSHKKAYKPFSKSVENIKRKQVEKEFSEKVTLIKINLEKEKQFNFQDELKQIPDQHKLKDMKNGIHQKI